MYKYIDIFFFYDISEADIWLLLIQRNCIFTVVLRVLPAIGTNFIILRRENVCIFLCTVWLQFASCSIRPRLNDHIGSQQGCNHNRVHIYQIFWCFREFSQCKSLFCKNECNIIYCRLLNGFLSDLLKVGISISEIN